MQDVVTRIWDFIDDFNINSVLKFLRDNIVGTVVLVSLLFWVPISCLISYVDRKRAEKVGKQPVEKLVVLRAKTVGAPSVWYFISHRSVQTRIKLFSAA